MKGGSNRSALVPIIISLACGACGLDPVPYSPFDQPAFRLSVWIDPDHPILDRGDVLEACDRWLAKGVVCRSAERRQLADVLISADDQQCEKDDDGKSVLGRAWEDGHIVAYSICYGSPGHYDRHKFRSVLTHEIGHSLGIWEHVPGDCQGEHLTHWNGEPVCGPAVMDATYDDDIYFVTVVDALAFDLRDRSRSRLKPLNANGDDADSDIAVEISSAPAGFDPSTPADPRAFSSF